MNDYRNWRRKRINVTSLLLDPDNIRLDLDPKNKTQDALIADLFSNEHAMEILEGIIHYGFFPDELPLVIEEKVKFIVLEGNRRVAALKAIINPSLIPTYETKIKKLISNIIPIDTIEVVIAPNREEALQLLANKHTKNTRKRWQPLRQAYFYHAQLESGKSIEALRVNYPGVDIVKFIKMWEMHTVARSIKYDSDEITTKVHDQRSFPVSTIERLYDDVEFRNRLNFDFDQNGKLRIDAEKDEFKKNLKRVIVNAIDKSDFDHYIDTRKLGRGRDREKYISSLDNLSTSKGDKVLESDDFTPLPTPEKLIQGPKLDPNGIVCTLKYPAVQRILQEVLNINYKRFPNATHDLLRTLLECSLKAFFDYKGVVLQKRQGQQYSFLSDVLIEAETYFTSNKKSLEAPIKIIRGNGRYLYSQDFLNAVNHNHNVFSTGINVKDAWEQMVPVLRYILDPK